MTRSTRIQIVRMYDVRSVAKWLETLSQCPMSIAEDVLGGSEYFLAFYRGKPAVLGWCQCDGTIFMHVDPAYLGNGLASMMSEFLEERLATAISSRQVEMV